MLKFLTGLFIGLSLATVAAQEYMPADVTTNGKLFGYVVIDKLGNDVCRDPSAWQPRNYEGTIYEGVIDCSQ